MSEQHTPEPCPVCDEGHLSRPFSIKECDSCGSEVSTPDLVEMNHRIQQAERQNAELLELLNEAVCALEVCGRDFRVTEVAREAIAKARGQQ